MPVFQPRNRVEIIREMVARTVARSKLVGLTRNWVFHILAAAANEDAEQYFQMARLREVFSIATATGSDLDARAAEILPGTIVRRPALAASGNVTFTRPGTAGTVVIPAGTIVSASDASGQIKFRTTSTGSITAGNTSSGLIAVTAVEPGVRGNVAANQIVKFVSRVPGVASVTNAVKYSNGRDRESDANFRGRLKSFVQSISRGTPAALEGYARNILLADGRRVLFAHVKEPPIPTGTVELFIDDGTGSVEEYSSAFVASPETILASALGGETEMYTLQKPIRDDGSFKLFINAAQQIRSTEPGVTQYYLNPANGQIVLDATAYPAGLIAGDTVTAEYRYYTGLIQETQRVIDGDPSTPLTRPGVRAAGTRVIVVAPSVVFQSVTAQISVASDFDTAAVSTSVASAIQNYINNLDIGEDVIVSEIIERAMAVDGMFNFTMTELTSSSPPADQVILDNQVARSTSAAITLT